MRHIASHPPEEAGTMRGLQRHRHVWPWAWALLLPWSAVAAPMALSTARHAASLPHGLAAAAVPASLLLWATLALRSPAAQHSPSPHWSWRLSIALHGLSWAVLGGAAWSTLGAAHALAVMGLVGVWLCGLLWFDVRTLRLTLACTLWPLAWGLVGLGESSALLPWLLSVWPLLPGMPWRQEAHVAAPRESFASSPSPTVQAFPGYITGVDAQLRYVFANDRIVEASGKPLSAWLGHRVADVLGPEREAFLAPLVARAMAGEPVVYEAQVPGLGSRDDLITLVTLARGTDLASGQPCCYAFGVDVSALKQSEHALLTAKEAAERANRIKTQFLSSMSHELRTPMNSVLGFGQLLEADAQQFSPQHRNYLREILRGGRHLLALINDLLDLARIESDRLALSLEPVDVAEVIEECRFLIQPLAERHHITVLQPDDTSAPALVLADRTRLRQVLLNLLSNAIKYNRQGGEVALSWTRHGDQVRIAVRDSGPGLSHDAQHKAFVAFERLGAELGHIEGAGIGLSLSQRLVHLMQGDIGVHSEMGVGSTFWVSLPRAEGVPSTSAAPALPDPTWNPADTLPRTVLYIEDNPVNTLLMEAMLARLPGLRLLTAAMPHDGLDLARQHHPDLILLDIQLPEMDGFEVFKHLQAAETTRDIPVIAVSASAMTQDIEQGRRLGFADYLTKPLDSQQLLQAVMRNLVPPTAAQGGTD